MYQMNFRLKFKEQAWAGGTNFVRLEILIKPRKLDKISKRISIEMERRWGEILSPWILTFRSSGNEKDSYKELRRNKWRQDENQERNALKVKRECFKEKKAKATWNGADRSDQTVTQSWPQEAAPDGTRLSKVQGQKEETKDRQLILEVLLWRGAAKWGGSQQGTWNQESSFLFTLMMGEGTACMMAV